MPAAQLVSSGLERALNHLIKLDPDSRAGLVPLVDKQLEVQIEEMPWVLVFAFSQRIDVLVNSAHSDRNEADCSIALSVESLQKLQDSSQLTTLIQQDKLRLEGDIHVAQDFSQFLKKIDIDWEEQLAKMTSDVFAHSAFVAGKTALEKIEKATGLIIETLSDGAIEEKKLAAHPLAVEDFCLQVSELRSSTERLDARLRQLEKQQ